MNALYCCSVSEISAPTSPGIEINVTPERDAPIIPKATTNHGDFLLPVKKVSFVAFFEVKCEIIIKTRKYAPIIPATKNGLIEINCSGKNDYFSLIL